MVFSPLMKGFAAPLFILMLLPSARQINGQELSGWEGLRKLAEERALVVCDPGDSYLPLAQEISSAESIPNFGSIKEALARNPRFLIWVGSPGYFTDKVLAQCGLLLKSADSGAAVGLVTGNSLEDARTLWLRGPQAKTERSTAVRGENSTAGIFGGQVLKSVNFESTGTLVNKQELIEELKVADYLTFAGKCSGSEWQLAEGTSFGASDIPRLSSAILTTAGCPALRLESSSPLALAAVAQGAAGYAGFFLRPFEGFLPGENGGLPLRYTWPEATVGDIIRLQNQSATQAFATVPLYFLLGDPRISFKREPPCTVLKIETSRGIKSYKYGDIAAGVFPLRIKNGAQYHYAEISGVTAISDYDLFYNSRLQAINEETDKILLISHSGGDLTINMQNEPPAFWRLSRTLLDALDYSLLYLPGSGRNPYLSLFLAMMALLSIACLIKRGGMPDGVLFPSILVGAVMGLSHALYASNRIALTAIISKPIEVGVMDIVATALLSSCGLILLIGFESVALKTAGVIIAVVPALGAAVFHCCRIFVFNAFYFKPLIGFGAYNYKIVLLVLIASLCEAAVFLLVAGFVYRAWKRRSKRSSTPH